jgi:hypothetical protein
MFYEPVDEWRRWATWLRAVLLIATALRLGQSGSSEQWAALGITRDLYTEFNYARDHQRQRENLASIVQRRFLRWSGLTPVIRWTGERPSLALAFGGDEAVKMRSSRRSQRACLPSLSREGQVLNAPCAANLIFASECHGTTSPYTARSANRSPSGETSGNRRKSGARRSGRDVRNLPQFLPRYRRTTANEQGRTSTGIPAIMRVVDGSERPRTGQRETLNQLVEGSSPSRLTQHLRGTTTEGRARGRGSSVLRE